MSKITHRSIGTFRLSSTDTTQLDSAGTWYDIAGNFADGSLNDFSLDSGSGELTYNGTSGKWFIAFGNSDLKADKTCTITYSFAKNGSIITNADSIVTFKNANSYRALGVNRPIQLDNGDVINVMAKSTANTTTITVYGLYVTLLGDISLK